MIPLKRLNGSKDPLIASLSTGRIYKIYDIYVWNTNYKAGTAGVLLYSLWLVFK